MMKYAGWALSVIAVICDSEHLPDSVKVVEVLNAVRHAPFYQTCFDGGKSPNDCLQLVVEAFIEGG